MTPAPVSTCRHCGEALNWTLAGWKHAAGPQERKYNCALEPYAKYHADPEDTE